MRVHLGGEMRLCPLYPMGLGTSGWEEDWIGKPTVFSQVNWMDFGLVILKKFFRHSEIGSDKIVVVLRRTCGSESDS